MSQGDTQEDALAMIRDAQQLWLRGALEDGWTIPEPRLNDSYSGKFNVRVPRSVHCDLVQAAESEGVSLNYQVGTALVRAAGVTRVRSTANSMAAAASDRADATAEVAAPGILERLNVLHGQLEDYRAGELSNLR